MLAKTGISGQEVKEVLSTKGTVHLKSFNMLFLGLILTKFHPESPINGQFSSTANIQFQKRARQQVFH